MEYPSYTFVSKPNINFKIRSNTFSSRKDLNIFNSKNTIDYIQYYVLSFAIFLLLTETEFGSPVLMCYLTALLKLLIFLKYL